MLLNFHYHTINSMTCITNLQLQESIVFKKLNIITFKNQLKMCIQINTMEKNILNTLNYVQHNIYIFITLLIYKK